MKRIFVDVEKCIGCQLCLLVCSLSKKGAIAPKSTLIRINEDGPDRILSVCLQCGHKTCQEGCLPNAIIESPIGAMIVDEKKCDGCRKCVGACNNKAIAIEGELAKICDLCGGAPACVEICPTGALKYDEIDSLREEKVAEAGRKLICAMGRK